MIGFRPNRQAILAVIAGVLPVAVIHFAYWLNVHLGEALAPEFRCMPYLDGCVSTSRAVRSGPGLIWFKSVMLPVALMMLFTWHSLKSWMARQTPALPAIRRWAVWLGIGGAIALVAYVIFLGTEGPVYAWLRRYGVVLFFGFTALAQLLAARFVWETARAELPLRVGTFVAVVVIQWTIGVFSVLKRILFSDPVLVDKIENVTEWLMILAMSAGFVVAGLILGAGSKRIQ